MAITGSSKIKDILANEEAKKIVRKYFPGIDDSRIKAGAGMPLKTVFAFPQSKVPKDVAAACIEELEKAKIE